MKLIVKMVLFHKNDQIEIESCQFRNGCCYVIKVWKREKYEPRRNIDIDIDQIGTLKELGLGLSEMCKKFYPVMNILKRPKKNIVQKIIDFGNHFIICVNFETVILC
jgi:hypothetical protein